MSRNLVYSIQKQVGCQEKTLEHCRVMRPLQTWSSSFRIVGSTLVHQLNGLSVLGI